MNLSYEWKTYFLWRAPCAERPGPSLPQKCVPYFCPPWKLLGTAVSLLQWKSVLAWWIHPAHVEMKNKLALLTHEVFQQKLTHIQLFPPSRERVFTWFFKFGGGTCSCFAPKTTHALVCGNLPIHRADQRVGIRRFRWIVLSVNLCECSWLPLLLQRKTVLRLTQLHQFVRHSYLSPCHKAQQEKIEKDKGYFLFSRHLLPPLQYTLPMSEKNQMCQRMLVSRPGDQGPHTTGPCVQAGFPTD